jgi:hypothetical protein
MKIRSLLLGSAAVAGLTTGAYAADLGVMTSLDVCDSLGLSGLTISSDTNCLQVSGDVKYKFTWGDYSNISHDPDLELPAGTKTYDEGNGDNDWESRFDAYLKVVATADSDFGPAKAVIKLKEVDDKRYVDTTGYAVLVSGTYTYTQGYGTGYVTASTTVYSGGATIAASTLTTSYAWNSAYGVAQVSGSDTNGVVMDEAYVSIGDSTVIMAGKKGTIYNTGDDVPLNWLTLFNSEKVDAGVDKNPNLTLDNGGHVIQITSDLGNGFSIGGGLENLNGSKGYDRGGTLVGVLAYAGDGISAHASFEAAGVLTGEIESWAAHAGFAGTFDNFKVVLAGAFDSTDYWNVLASASATFDMFTIAGSVEAANGDCSTGITNCGSDDYFGAGGSLSAKVTDTVTVNVGGRWAHTATGEDDYEVAAGVVAAVTDTLTLTGKVGYVTDPWSDMFYGQGIIAWAPGGGLTTSVTGTVNSMGGYKIETVFEKAFQ